MSQSDAFPIESYAFGAIITLVLLLLHIIIMDTEKTNIYYF